jgi:hypothetical protein
VLAALSRIIDPDFGEDIVACGFVRDLATGAHFQILWLGCLSRNVSSFPTAGSQHDSDPTRSFRCALVSNVQTKPPAACASSCS